MNLGEGMKLWFTFLYHIGIYICEKGVPTFKNIRLFLIIISIIGVCHSQTHSLTMECLALIL